MRREDHPPILDSRAMPDGPDLIHVKGQEAAKRALEVAAAGNHSILLVGPRAAGKTMLARCLPGLLPPPTEDEAAQSYPAEAFGDGIVGFRFGEAAGDTSDPADDTPAKVDTPATTRRPVRVSKRRAAAAAA